MASTIDKSPRVIKSSTIENPAVATRRLRRVAIISETLANARVFSLNFEHGTKINPFFPCILISLPNSSEPREIPLIHPGPTAISARNMPASNRRERYDRCLDCDRQTAADIGPDKKVPGNREFYSGCCWAGVKSEAADDVHQPHPDILGPHVVQR
jgi:hypothetical protein